MADDATPAPPPPETALVESAGKVHRLTHIRDVNGRITHVARGGRMVSVEALAAAEAQANAERAAQQQARQQAELARALATSDLPLIGVEPRKRGAAAEPPSITDQLDSLFKWFGVA